MQAHPPIADRNEEGPSVAALSATLNCPPRRSMERALDEFVLLICELSAIEHRMAANGAITG